MDANAELNQTLLNAMFALNEAGDNLDEIYRIGLETAVCLLNADRGCIFKRDSWNDNKWTFTKGFNLNKREGDSISSQTFSKLLNQTKSNIFHSQNIIFYSLKIYNWPSIILYIEGNHLIQLDKYSQSLFDRFIDQFKILLQKRTQYETVKQIIEVVLFSFRGPIGNVIGYSEVLKESLVGELSKDQQKCAVGISREARKISNWVEQIVFSHRQFQGFTIEETSIQEIRKKLGSEQEKVSLKSLDLSTKLYIDKYHLPYILYSLLEKADSCQIELQEDSRHVQIQYFYGDAEAFPIKLTNQIYLVESVIVPKRSVSLEIIKSHINYMGGVFKISAEAGKGYTLTITFPIVTEDAHE